MHGWCLDIQRLNAAWADLAIFGLIGGQHASPKNWHAWPDCIASLVLPPVRHHCANKSW